jgi:phosphoribosylanthranilate isomerase
VTRVKVCGITNEQDAELAVELGAWALGCIFFDGSPRSCDPAVAAGIAERYRRRAEIVGVFVDPALEDVARAVETLGLSAVQLHGSVGPTFCAEIGRRTGAKVIRAFEIRSNSDVQASRAFRSGVDFHLFDTRVIGGTGETWDWSLARHRGPRALPLILSGGLTPENVAEGIAAVEPYAVDTASGTEASPGVKDPDKLRAFFEAAMVPAT